MEWDFTNSGLYEIYIQQNVFSTYIHMYLLITIDYLFFARYLNLLNTSVQN
jgi:hypothetical protein